MNKKGTSDASVQIYGDGTLLYTSVPFNGSDNAISVYLDITGVKILKFCADGKNGSEQIALADVMLENQKDKETLNLKVGDQAVFLRNIPYTGRPRENQRLSAVIRSVEREMKGVVGDRTQCRKCNDPGKIWQQ